MLSSKLSKWGWGFTYNGLSYNNLAIFKQDSAITGLSYNQKGQSYNGKSYNGQEPAITESAITDTAITERAITESAITQNRKEP